MAGAISRYIEKKWDCALANAFNVSKSTLRRKIIRLQADNLSVEQSSNKKLGTNPVFTKEQEKELVAHILILYMKMTFLVSHKQMYAN